MSLLPGSSSMRSKGSHWVSLGDGLDRLFWLRLLMLKVKDTVPALWSVATVRRTLEAADAQRAPPSAEWLPPAVAYWLTRLVSTVVEQV